MDLTDRDIEDWLLEKLVRHHNWTHRYVARRDALKYLPKNILRTADRAIDSLLREGLLGSYKKGDCIYLVPSRRAEILYRSDAFKEKVYGKQLPLLG